MEKDIKLIYFCPFSIGGLSDYAQYQAEALGHAGMDVTMLCDRDYPHEPVAYRQDRSLPGGGPRPKTKAARILKLVKETFGGYALLDKRLAETGAKKVIFASFTEYMGPLWAWRFRRWKKKGVVFGAVVHDPVRDFVLGPQWWHDWSVSEGYSFLRHAFVHEPIQLDTGMFRQRVTTTVIPHGPFAFPESRVSRIEARRELKIPEDVPLFLSFGHLRDGKNLPLVLEAMKDVPQVWLLVAGTEARSGNVTSHEYQKMAELLGVSARCRWRIGFASPEEVAKYFAAADYALLAYEARFRSASGVLNVAVGYRKPVIVSCGESNLATVVDKYRLGPRVEPDDAQAIRKGMADILVAPPNPDWETYDRDNSWATNARTVISALEEPRAA